MLAVKNLSRPGLEPTSFELAAGECVGGIIGPVYVGSGNSLGTCTTFGRLAGLAAAEGTRP